MFFKCRKGGNRISAFKNLFGSEVYSECEKWEEACLAECKKQAEANGRLIFENSRNAQFKLSEHCPNCSSNEKTDLPDLKTRSFYLFSPYILPSDTLFVEKVKCAKCGYFWCIPRNVVTLLAIICLAVICSAGGILLLEDARTCQKELYGNNKNLENTQSQGNKKIAVWFFYGWYIAISISVIISACRAMALHAKPKSLVE